MQLSKSLRVSLCATVVALGVTAANGAPDDPAILKEAIKEWKSEGKQDRGYSHKQKQLAKRLSDLGPPVIPRLIELLQDPDEGVRTMAGYVLSDLKIPERYLPALVAASESGLSEVAPAIGEIGTPAAAEYLIDKLARAHWEESAYPLSTLETGITRLGRAAAAPLMRLFQQPETWTDTLRETMPALLAPLAKQDPSLIETLTRTAADETQPDFLRECAVAALAGAGAAGSSARAVVEGIYRKAKGSLKAFSAEVLVGWGGEVALEILKQRLSDPNENYRSVESAAELRDGARALGPELVRLLNEYHGSLQASAASALGLTGYRESEPDLIEAANQREDWRLAFCAVEALGHLRSETALPSLEAIGLRHWYPPVRKAAILAVQEVHSGLSKEESSASWIFRSEISDLGEWSQRAESVTWEEFKRGAMSHDFLPRSDSALPSALITTVKGGLEPEQRKLSKIVGIKVGDEYLVGTNGGEFGGKVLAIDAAGKISAIMEEDTEALYFDNGRVVVICGLAHKSLNFGRAYRLQKKADGLWGVVQLFTLPGAPLFSCCRKDGAILVSCNGGVVELDQADNLTFVPRLEVLKMERRKAQKP